MTIEQIYDKYVLAKNDREKSKAIEHAIIAYGPKIYKLRMKYSTMFPSIDEDDVTSWAHEGIWLGFIKKQPHFTIRTSIFMQIRAVISKEIQLICAEKNSAWYEEPIVYEGLNFETPSFENSWVLQQDIEQGLLLLPSVVQTVVRLWLQGYHYMEICEHVKLKDACVYNYINRGKAVLSSYLGDSYQLDLL